MPAMSRPRQGPAAPRRLSKIARHEQLTAAAMPLVARHGFSEFSLDEVTERAGVTRKLLYHYFPRGRADVVLAVAERAGHELTDGWIVEQAIPLDQRLAANNTRIIEHAMKPSDAWTIYRLARSSPDPEISEKVNRFVDLVVATVAQNHLGTSTPSPLPRMAIRGFLAFFESVLDDARTTGASLEVILPMLAGTLRHAVDAAVSAEQ